LTVQRFSRNISREGQAVNARTISGLFALLASLCAVACGSDGTEVPPPPASDSGAEVGDGASDAIGSDALVDADLDAGPVVKGKTAHATVTGGVKMSSPGYKMIMTMGDGPGGGVNMSSPNHKLRVGVVGVTQQ
jgi:hypothetical protein